MSTITRHIPYADAHERHIGDLFFPERPLAGAPPVLLIHGGGWNAMTKESLDPIARLATAEGRAVFSINYRLLDHAPWPACRDDCVAAARFLLADGLAPHGLAAPATGQLLVVGASAGGHLAMMTGLALGAHACTGIVSLAGPSRVDPRDDVSKSAICQPGFLAKFFGGDKQPSAVELRDASPAALVTPAAPPLRILHSKNDLLVPPTHSEEAAAAWRAAGVPARIDYFDGPGDLHGFWDSDDLAKRELIPVMAALIREALILRLH
ncbi:MAG: alpha/beta hydrolase [Verrucomicrobiota bacterium]